MADIVSVYQDGSGTFVQSRQESQTGMASPREAEATLVFSLSGDLASADFQQELLRKAGETGVPEQKIRRFFIN